MRKKKKKKKNLLLQMRTAQRTATLRRDSLTEASCRCCTPGCSRAGDIYIGLRLVVVVAAAAAVAVPASSVNPFHRLMHGLRCRDADARALKLELLERRQRAAVERGGEGGASGVGDPGVVEVEPPGASSALPPAAAACLRQAAAAPRGRRGPRRRTGCQQR